jgi:antirestriction protein ArdC
LTAKLGHGNVRFMSSANIYQVVTDRILAALAQNIVPWQKPWRTSAPTNLLSKKAYRGVNVLLLSCSGYSSHYWGTYKQITEAGGQVRRGEKGTPIVFWSMFEKMVDGKPKKVFVLRQYTVFNVEQCDGLEALKTAPSDLQVPMAHEALESAAAAILEGYKGAPQVIVGYNRTKACYKPSLDVVEVPGREYFNSPEGFYSILYHELAHSTGHKSRLGRIGVTDVDAFGSHRYSFEELVAEITSAFMMHHVGLDSEVAFENQAAYIQGWRAKLGENPKWIVDAAGKAAKAFEHILGVSAAALPTDEEISEAA